VLPMEGGSVAAGKPDEESEKAQPGDEREGGT
jgi:hypothetical protein